jgi:hypothetical protein
VAIGKHQHFRAFGLGCATARTDYGAENDPLIGIAAAADFLGEG